MHHQWWPNSQLRLPSTAGNKRVTATLDLFSLLHHRRLLLLAPMSLSSPAPPPCLWNESRYSFSFGPPGNLLPETSVLVVPPSPTAAEGAAAESSVSHGVSVGSWSAQSACGCTRSAGRARPPFEVSGAAGVVCVSALPVQRSQSSSCSSAGAPAHMPAGMRHAPARSGPSSRASAARARAAQRRPDAPQQKAAPCASQSREHSGDLGRGLLRGTLFVLQHRRQQCRCAQQRNAPESWRRDAEVQVRNRRCPLRVLRV